MRSTAPAAGLLGLLIGLAAGTVTFRTNDAVLDEFATKVRPDPRVKKMLVRIAEYRRRRHHPFRSEFPDADAAVERILSSATSAGDLDERSPTPPAASRGRDGAG